MHLEEILISLSFWNAPVEFNVCLFNILAMFYVIQYSRCTFKIAEENAD